METIKKTFGLILLATAWWILFPVMNESLHMAGFGVLAILASVLFKTFERSPNHPHFSARLGKAFGIIFIALGLAWLAGALGGATQLDRPLSPFIANKTPTIVHEPPLAMQTVTTVTALDEALRDTQKPVFIDVYAEWCVSCKEFERNTLGDPAVRDALSAFTLIRVDATASDKEARNLLRRFGLYGPPGMVFYAPGARLLLDTTLAGYVGPEDFLKNLHRVAVMAEKSVH